MEGAFVRAAYNNEGYAILGYQTANESVKQPWLVLDLGVTLRSGQKAQKLTRGAGCVSSSPKCLHDSGRVEKTRGHCRERQ